MNRVVRQIVQAVADKHDVTVNRILSYDGRAEYTRARHEAWHLIREHNPTLYTYPHIARQMNRMDHTTIMMGIRSHLRREAKAEPQNRKAA